MKPREFHLYDFPENIRILLKKSVYDEFFEACIQRFDNIENYSKFLSVPRSMGFAWKRQYLFIPLWVFRKTIIEISWTWNYIERSIIAYKSINTSKPVTKPILPIKESPELFELIAHLICDGCVSKQGVPIYVNTRPELIENVRELLCKIFGNVHGDLRKLQPSNCYQYNFSKIVFELVYHFYRTEFGSLKAILPKEIFELPEEFGRSVIRAVIDDEGSVKDNRIQISMKNEKLMVQISQLLISMLGEGSVSALTKTTENRWFVTVKASGMKEFRMKVELIHPTKKKDMEFFANKTRLVGQHKPVWDSKITTLELLMNESLTTKQISQKLLINTRNILSHLREMEVKGLVKNTKKKYTFIWEINKNGLDFLEKVRQQTTFRR